MNRRVVLVVTVLIYVAAWVSPVAAGGMTLAKGGLPGWEAFRLGLSPLWDANARETWYGAGLSVVSALTNAWFVFVVVALWRSSGVSRRALVWGSIVAALINAHWLFLYTPRTDLRIGYYLWWLSFGALAIAASVRSGPATTLGATDS